MLKAIFFDADGTLVDHEECERLALMHVFAGIGLPYRDEIQRVFRPLDAELWNGEIHGGGKIPPEEIPTYRFKCLFERVGVDFCDYARANELFKQGLAGATALIGGAAELIADLHGAGYVLCVVTNGLVELQLPRVANSEIGKFISEIIVSEEVGAPKPNPLIFRTLLARLGLNAGEVIMVGDSLKNDILGAKNAGIKACWFNPARAENRTGIAPDFEIDNLSRLQGIILE